MKIRRFKTVVFAMAGTVIMSSCVGSFGLFNKLAQWNKRATNNKFINELIFLIISPAYGICGAVDALVLNTIEFWTGNNPIANNVGKTTNIKGDDGLIYAVKYLQNGYEITKPDGDVYSFIYDKENNSWSMKKDGVTKEIFRFNGDGTVQANMQNGKKINVTMDQAGLFEVKMAAADGTYMALR